MNNADSKTNHLLAQAYILGGSPCSGKSTLAQQLSQKFKLPYYKVDDHQEAHAQRIDPILHPTMSKYAAMSWNEIWMRPIPDQVAEEFVFYRERFEMIHEDLGEFDATKPIILEGAAYLPELIAQHGADPRRVVYLVPTKEFQLHYYRQRPWIHSILQACTDPEQAFANWMQRDHLFGQEILRQAEAYGYKTILVDGRRTIAEQLAEVEKQFKLR